MRRLTVFCAILLLGAATAAAQGQRARLRAAAEAAEQPGGAAATSAAPRAAPPDAGAPPAPAAWPDVRARGGLRGGVLPGGAWRGARGAADGRRLRADVGQCVRPGARWPCPVGRAGGGWGGAWGAAAGAGAWGRGRCGRGPDGQAGCRCAAVCRPAAARGPLTEAERAALREALGAELAVAEYYRGVLERFGAQRPLDNLRAAEERHIAALRNLCERYGVEEPAAGELDVPQVPDTLAAALAQAAELERADGALYDRLLGQVDNADVRTVFERLRAASLERHLPAVQAGGGAGPGPRAREPQASPGAPRGRRGR